MVECGNQIFSVPELTGLLEEDKTRSYSCEILSLFFVSIS